MALEGLLLSRWDYSGYGLPEFVCHLFFFRKIRLDLGNLADVLRLS